MAATGNNAISSVGMSINEQKWPRLSGRLYVDRRANGYDRSNGILVGASSQLCCAKTCRKAKYNNEDEKGRRSGNLKFVLGQ